MSVPASVGHKTCQDNTYFACASNILCVVVVCVPDEDGDDVDEATDLFMIV